MRLFIAIKIAPNSELYDILHKLETYGKAVELENIHLTLKFLGEVIDAGKTISALELIKFKSFDLELKGMDVLPNERKPRILFLRAFPEDILNSLASEIDTATKEISRDHPFTPHITVLRIKNYGDLKNIVEQYKNKYILKHKVSHFSLFKSTLTPKGPIYEELKKFQLI